MLRPLLASWMTVAVLAPAAFTQEARAQEAPTSPTTSAPAAPDASEARPGDVVDPSDPTKPAEVPAQTTAPEAPVSPPPASEPLAPEEKDSSFGKLPAKQEQTVGANPRLGGDIPGIRSRPDSDFMDTRLTFSFSDDDWFSGPGRTTPSSPLVDFNPRSNNRAFFDALNRRDSGYETMTHMVLTRRQDGFLPGLDTEAAMVARFQFAADDDTGRFNSLFLDDGSYIRARYFFGGVIDDKAANIDLVMFPFNSDRFRLGYLYDISWGGNAIFPSRGVAAPGAKLQVTMGDGYAYVGAKTARLLDENVNEVEANWGFLSGAGWDFLDMITVDVGAGYFDRGTNPRAGVEGQALQGFGGSSRVSLHLGREVPSTLDFRLYRNDPGLLDLFRINARGKAGISFLASLEYTYVGQTLQDSSNALSTTVQHANAAALSMRLGIDNASFGVDTIYRDLAFITLNRPSFTPYQAFPKDSVTTPELLTSLSASYFIEQLHLTPGIIFGLQLPSTFVGLNPDALGSSKPVDISRDRVVVVRNAFSQDILPCGQFDDPNAANRQCVRARQAEPLYAFRGSLKWDLSEMLALVGEATLTVDNNEANIVKGDNGAATRAVVTNFDPGFALLPGTSHPYNLRLAAGLFAQARF